jgi:FkbM family methyltransferase
MIHTFDNSVKVFDNHLIPLQRKRYQKCNLHEPVEERWFTKIINNSSGPFIDVGAAIGYYSMLARKIRPKMRIVAYEPSRVNFGRMIENIKLNNLTFIEVKMQAISNRNGTSRFKEGLYGSVLSGEGDNEVDVIRLADDHNKIGICKVDVQGHEYEVLLGSAGCKVHAWIIGTHGPGIHKRCLQWLENKRYKIRYQSHSVPGQPDGLIVAFNFRK